MTAMTAQLRASEPKTSVFVTANAGSGKTKTLVDRVARLLLQGVEPHAILCVTYTKAAAAEMQTRLFRQLGEWAVMDKEPLEEALAKIESHPGDISDARALFARALETPGGLKIQTIHAFCEKLLKRFPLEAGVSPNFRVLEDQAARQVSARAREETALRAMADPDGPIGRAYARVMVLHVTVLGAVWLIAAFQLPAIVAVFLVVLHALVDVASTLIGSRVRSGAPAGGRRWVQTGPGRWQLVRDPLVSPESAPDAAERS